MGMSWRRFLGFRSEVPDARNASAARHSGRSSSWSAHCLALDTGSHCYCVVVCREVQWRRCAQVSATLDLTSGVEEEKGSTRRVRCVRAKATLQAVLHPGSVGLEHGTNRVVLLIMVVVVVVVVVDV
jgi:hypothetical protein